MTNYQLLQYHNEIEGFKDSILGIFFIGKIREFYRNNGIRLKSLMEKVEALNREFFRIEEDKMIYGPDKKPILLEGKTQAEYDERSKALLSQEINIIL